VLGSPHDSTERQRRRLTLLLTAFLLGSNIFGAAIAVVLVIYVIPGPDLHTSEFHTLITVVLPIFLAIAFAVGAASGAHLGARAFDWLADEREPTRSERLAAITLPWRLTLVQVALWVFAAVFFAVAVGMLGEHDAVPKVGFTVLLSGLTVSSFAYVLAEFALRPIAARALAAGPDLPITRFSGLSARTLLPWILGTGVPLTGLMIVAFFSLYVRPASATRLAATILVLGAIALVAGFTLIHLNTRQITDPLRSVIAGIGRVERGDYEQATVVVYDGTELGALQNGFNRMVDGLVERERIRDLFGRQVGREVAEAALQNPPTLGGEERDVAVFFIDIVGSTALAASRPPQDVVDLLNRFFDVVVDEVDRGGGVINKFEGDAALAIFGAPFDSPDPAGCALSSARAIRSRLPQEVPDCKAAIGVAYGRAVAGNVGSRDRFEYTVIGYPINEAARLCELAKQHSTMVLASDRAIETANPAEAVRWARGDEVVLRGRNDVTRTAFPAEHPTIEGD